MKREHLLKAIVVCFTVLTTIFSAGIGFCDPDVLVEEGKTELFQNMDVYAADAKFTQALVEDPTHQKANFWRAITVISSNPDLNTFLKNMGIIDAGNNIAFLDEEGQPKDIFSKVDTIIIDNDDANYSEVGSGWTTASEGYGGDCRTHSAGGSGISKAIWTPNITVAGDYYISMWWGYSTNNSPDAEVKIYCEEDDGTQITKTFTLSQLKDSDRWSRLSVCRLSPGKNHRVELSDKGSGVQVMADAVKFEYDATVMDDLSAGVVFNNGSSESWQDVSGSGRNNKYKVIAAGTGGSCVYTPTIPADGKYRLEIEYFDSSLNTTDATYEIWVGGSLVNTLHIDQKSGDYGRRLNGGLYQFQAGVGNQIILKQSPDGAVTVDTLRIISVRYDLTLTEVQSIDSSTLTQTDQALTYLGNVTNAFQDTVTLEEGPPPTVIEIDYGDALMLKSFLNLYKSQANTFAAHNMDNLSPTKLASTYEELISMNWILDTYVNLGNLNPDAATKLAAAKAALIEGINRYFDGYNSIKGEGDLQDNDFITFDPEDSESTEAVNAKLDEVLKNLNGTTPSFTVSSDDFGMSEPGDSEYLKVVVNLRAFFDTPTAPRSLLPSFDDEDNLIRNSWPDPTFGGVLPNMTVAELDGLAKLGSYLYRPQVYWNGDAVSIILNWKKDTYTDFLSYKIYRSTTDNVDETSTLVYDSTNKDVTTYTDTTIDSNQRTYYYRLYTYYSDGDKIAGLIRRVVTKIYVDIANTSGIEDGSPEHPYKLLRDGIDASGNGAKVCVAQGTYPESDRSLGRLSRRPGIVLEGGYESTNWTRDIKAYPTIIDGTGLEGNVVGIYDANDITIDGFTIRDAQYNGIGLHNATGITISNCTLTNNGDLGIGAWNNSSLIVKDSIITQNQDGGIHISDNTSLTITGSEVFGNVGNGIFIQNVSPNKWYSVYGENTYISGVQGYRPGDYGYTFLGSDPVTMTFNGSYTYYCIVTNAGQPVMVDTVQLSDGSYYNPTSYTTGNTQNWTSVGGAPDGAYATVGTGDTGGYFLVGPLSGNTSLKVYIVDAPSTGADVKILNCLIKDNNPAGRRDGITLKNSFDKATIKNNLIKGNGIGSDGRDSPTIINNTIVNSAWGIVWSSSSTPHDESIMPTIKNNIITGNNVGIHFENGIGSPIIDYNDVWGNTSNYSGCSAGAQDISVDPKFVDGPLGKCYLSQIASWQSINSPCLDAGSDTASTLGFTDNYTTRTDGQADTGQVDLGYHYPAYINSISAIAINEFLPNPLGDDPGKEWVELYNRSSNPVDISGCVIDDVIGSEGEPLVIPFGTTISSYGFYTVDLPGTYLNNDSDTVNLLWPNAVSILDTYSYTATTEGASNYRFPDGAAWVAGVDNTPTKGLRNDGNRPSVGTITPSSGTSQPNTPVSFTATYSDPDGWQNIKQAQLRVNNIASNKNCFVGYYNQNTQKLYLRNDANTIWLGGFAPGSSNIIENSYAKLDCAGVTVSGSGNTLTVNWNVIFKPTFTGIKKTYLYVQDNVGVYDGWDRKGSWTITP